MDKGADTRTVVDKWTVDGRVVHLLMGADGRHVVEIPADRASLVCPIEIGLARQAFAATLSVLEQGEESSLVVLLRVQQSYAWLQGSESGENIQN